MPSKPTTTPERRHAAGVLDIRNIIGMLLAAYGVILTLVGLLGDAETEKTGGPNANLWTGIGLLVVGLGFVAWARLRPILVPETHTDGKAADRDAG